MERERASSTRGWSLARTGGCRTETHPDKKPGQARAEKTLAIRGYPFGGEGCYVVTGKVDEEFGFYSITVNEMHRLDMITREDAVGV